MIEVIFTSAECEVVCDVKEKLCYVALGNGTELKCTAASSDEEETDELHYLGCREFR